jgi:hypothetical protein
MKKTIAEMKQELGPKKTVKAYKLFRVHPDHPGKLFPLFIGAKKPVEIGKWTPAENIPTSGFADRPGWHAGEHPVATHIGEKSDPKNMVKKPPDRRPHNQAWAEVEMPHDVDWQSEANKRGTNAKGKVIAAKAHITDEIPVGGHYRYKTNPNMTGSWLIGGSLKVNKVLTDDEVSRINKKAGVADLPRTKPFNKKEYGFKKGGLVSAEERKANLAKMLKSSAVKKRLYHGTKSDIREIDTTKSKRLPGFWMSSDPKVADAYSADGLVNPTAYPAGANIMPVHVQITKPYKFNRKKKEFWQAFDEYLNGDYDGFIYDKNVVVKHPHQVKSAIGNQGTYDASSPDITKADGGTVKGKAMPSIAQMKMALSRAPDLRNMGVNQAIGTRAYSNPDPKSNGLPPVGGVSDSGGLPVGGVDTDSTVPGQQMKPPVNQPQQPFPPPDGGMQTHPNVGIKEPPPAMGNMLSMTPQGQTLGALSGMPGKAGGGRITRQQLEQIRSRVARFDKGGAVDSPHYEATDNPKRVKLNVEGHGNVKGIVVPKHMMEGNSWVDKKSGREQKIPGLLDVAEARSKVYGSEHRAPLSISDVGRQHKKILDEHFSRPIEEQKQHEESALGRLREAKHINHNADTLDESEKLDTVHHEYGENGKPFIGFASKGVAGHAPYISGHGKDAKIHVLNTCPGQTAGCGGGTDKDGVVDTSRGTCFAPNAESQYAAASVRRAAHEHAKHDPAMTKDWILAHTGSLRNAARMADKKNVNLLFRPNVVDETDVSSRHVIRHLNQQRKAEGKSKIIANSYGKTTELHDPENGYHVTHSNVGPKVKQGKEIAENVDRDKQRVSQTIHAADFRTGEKHFLNEQGNKTPPKNSYMVTDVKRGSQMSKDMEKSIKHAKYWGAGRLSHELSEKERAEGDEGHFDGKGNSVEEGKSHYGHKTVEGKRYDYQRQHILHPRLVQVGHNADGTPHMIPTDSRFKDNDFLPKNRFKTKNGKNAGAILMTTPTESTSNLGHQTSFTHHVSPAHVEHAKKYNGEYEIDNPMEQEKAKGKEYAAPQPIQILKKKKGFAVGGSVGGEKIDGLYADNCHAFPESNYAAQHHLAKRYGIESEDHVSLDDLYANKVQ